MRTWTLRGGAFAALLLLLWQPTAASAHPHFVGRWTAPVPPGGLMALEFGSAKYIGAGAWCGPFQFTINGAGVTFGDYVLRMSSGTEGTLEFFDTTRVPSRIGSVDLGARTITHMWVVYRQDAGLVPPPPPPTPPTPPSTPPEPRDRGTPGPERGGKPDVKADRKPDDGKKAGADKP